MKCIRSVAANPEKGKKRQAKPIIMSRFGGENPAVEKGTESIKVCQESFIVKLAIPVLLQHSCIISSAIIPITRFKLLSTGKSLNSNQSSLLF